MSVATAPRAATALGRAVPWAGLVARLVLGGLFVYAGALKVTVPKEAGLAVQAYRLFPPDIARTIGYALPTIEIILGLLLIVGLFTRLAAAAVGLLLVAFVIGIVSVWVRGYNIDCGCFGGGGDVTASGRNLRYATEIVRDGLMIALAAFLVWRPRTPLSLDRFLYPDPVASGDAAGTDTDTDTDEPDDTDDPAVTAAQRED